MADTTTTNPDPGAQAPAFIPLEANPQLMTSLIHKLGVAPSLEMHDVYSLTEPDLLAFIPRPALALLLVFPVSATYESHRMAEDSIVDVYSGKGSDEPVLWWRQTIRNACGMMGLLHAVCNGASRDFIGASTLNPPSTQRRATPRLTRQQKPTRPSTSSSRPRSLSTPSPAQRSSKPHPSWPQHTRKPLRRATRRRPTPRTTSTCTTCASSRERTAASGSWMDAARGPSGEETSRRTTTCLASRVLRWVRSSSSRGRVRICASAPWPWPERRTRLSCGHEN